MTAKSQQTTSKIILVMMIFTFSDWFRIHKILINSNLINLLSERKGEEWDSVKARQMIKSVSSNLKNTREIDQDWVKVEEFDDEIADHE